MSKRLLHDVFDIPERSKTINQKVKGNKNELEAAKWLERWTGRKFTRTPSSGGLRWKNAAKVVGDVVCEDDSFDFPFVVETKHLAELNYRINSSPAFKGWRQVLKDCERIGGGKMPLMMLRSNGMEKGSYNIHFHEKLSMPMQDEFNIDPQVRVEFGTRVKADQWTYEWVLGFNSEEFLEKVNYEKFVAFAKNF